MTLDIFEWTTVDCVCVCVWVSNRDKPFVHMVCYRSNGKFTSNLHLQWAHFGIVMTTEPILIDRCGIFFFLFVSSPSLSDFQHFRCNLWCKRGTRVVDGWELTEIDPIFQLFSSTCFDHTKMWNGDDDARNERHTNCDKWRLLSVTDWKPVATHTSIP